MTDDSLESGVRPVKSAAYAVEVLEFLSSRQNKPARLREISEALRIPKSSLYALLRTLAHRGWVRRDETGTLYGVGIRALMAGMSYLDSDPYLRLVQPWLDELKEQLDETVHFGRLDGNDIIYLATRESSQYLRVINRVGRRLPASATSLGKALLAERDEVGRLEHMSTPLPRLTSKTITDPEVLRKDLDDTVERGYAVDIEENTTGLKCFGFALHYANPPIDAISCSVPIARLTEERQAHIIDAMSATVAKIERHSPSAVEGFQPAF
ncbi:MAG: transcriptional regulator, IclR family [Rhodoglobus sp.]|nr:transcriptional regulator, IclR family [Rhodoglobus sp.]